MVQQARTDEERNKIYAFRYRVYISEMAKPMPEADHVNGLLYDAFDNDAIHLYIERDSQIVGALRLIWGRNGWPPAYSSWYDLPRFSHISPDKISFTGRLMVAKGHRNSALGGILAREIYTIGRDLGLLFDFIHTTPDLLAFFERLGHRRYKENFIDANLGCRIPMVLALHDLRHLERCHSPFLSVAERYQNDAESAAWFNNSFTHPPHL